MRATIEQACIQAFDPTADCVGWERTAVVATVLSFLARMAPVTPFCGRLRERLISGMITDSELGLRCWSERLATSGSDQRLIPSVPHTARAIIALGHEDHSDHGTSRAIDEAVLSSPMPG